jgi:DNA-binding response OmpR family regulator
MDFRILGPLEVADHGREPVIASGKQRALLAILLLHANEVVSRDRLIAGSSPGSELPSRESGTHGCLPAAVGLRAAIAAA